MVKSEGRDAQRNGIHDFVGSKLKVLKRRIFQLMWPSTPGSTSQQKRSTLAQTWNTLQ